MGTSIPDLTGSEGVFASFARRNFGDVIADGETIDFVIDTDDPAEYEFYALKLARMKFPNAKLRSSGGTVEKRKGVSVPVPEIVPMTVLEVVETVLEEVPEAVVETVGVSEPDPKEGASADSSSFPSAEEVLSIPESQLVASAWSGGMTEMDNEVTSFLEETAESSNTSSQLPQNCSSDSVVTSTTEDVLEIQNQACVESQLNSGRSSRMKRFYIPSAPGSTLSDISDISALRDGDLVSDFMEFVASDRDMSSVFQHWSMYEAGQEETLEDPEVDPPPRGGSSEGESLGNSTQQLTRTIEEAPPEPVPKKNPREIKRSSKTSDEDGPSSCIPNLKSRKPIGAALKRMNVFRNLAPKKKKDNSEETPGREVPGNPGGDSSGPAYNLRSKDRKKTRGRTKTSKTNERNANKAAVVPNTPKKKLRHDPRMILKSKSKDYGPEPFILLMDIIASTSTQNVTGSESSGSRSSASSDSSSAPEDSTEVSQSEPEVLMSEPEVLTSETEVSISEPEVLISVLEILTSESEALTSEPEILISDPEVLRSEPELLKSPSLVSESTNSARNSLNSGKSPNSTSEIASPSRSSPPELISSNSSSPNCSPVTIVEVNLRREEERKQDSHPPPVIDLTTDKKSDLTPIIDLENDLKQFPSLIDLSEEEETCPEPDLILPVEDEKSSGCKESKDSPGSPPIIDLTLEDEMPRTSPMNFTTEEEDRKLHEQQPPVNDLSTNTSPLEEPPVIDLSTNTTPPEEPPVIDLAELEESEQSIFDAPPKPKNPFFQFRFQFPKTPNPEKVGWAFFTTGRIPRPPEFQHLHPQILQRSILNSEGTFSLRDSSTICFSPSI